MSDPGGREMEDLRLRLGTLIERVDLGDDARELASEALEELAVVIEELQSQNAELVASREALDEQTGRYRDLFESVADGYLITDTNGIIREVNLAACEMFGRPRDQVVDKPLAAFIDVADRAAFYAQLNRIRHAEAGGHLTTDLAVRDHETVPTNLRATRALPRADGESEVTWLLRDRRHDLVTEELRSSQQRLRALFESARVGIVLGDTAGEIVFVNRLGSDLLEFGDDGTAERAWLSTVHPEDRAVVEAAIRSALDGQVSGLRHRVVHGDGTELWVDHSIAPFRESNSVTGFVSTLVDVTAEQTAMNELATSRDFTEALLDIAGALVVVMDPVGRVQRFNKTCEAVSGFSASEVVGRSIVEFVPAERRAEAADFLTGLSRSGVTPLSGHYEGTWLTKDGGRRRISWTYRTLTDADGVVAIIGTGIDVTERRLLESQLAQADRLDSIGRLTAGVAHDFNNTLTTLRLRFDRLGGRDLDDDSRGDIEAAVGTIDRTQHLIGDLLLFSRRGVSEPIEVEINTEIRRVTVTDILDDLFGDDVTIDLRLTPNPTPVIIDPARFEQALTNLAINARDAMSGGGVLTISTDLETIEPFAPTDPRIASRLPPGDYVMLSVADTGVGIEPDDLAHVFDPYFTTKPVGRGTGLGLATTYGAIVQSGGSITVDSRPGHGTTFRIRLPLEPSVPDVAGTPQGHATDGRASVLVVDDDEDLRRVIVDELTRLGYRTTQAESAAAALDRIDDHVDVLLCDVQLPDLGGPDVATRFLDRHRDLFVVFISGAPAAQLRELLPLGAVVLPKPFTTADLVAALTARPDRA